MQFEALAALGAQNSGRALATAASKSFSVPGLTSICAISVIIGVATSMRTIPVSNPACRPQKEKAPRGARVVPFSTTAQLQQQHRTGNHQRAADEHHHRPAAARLVVAALRAPFRDQRASRIRRRSKTGRQIRRAPIRRRLRATSGRCRRWRCRHVSMESDDMDANGKPAVTIRASSAHASRRDAPDAAVVLAMPAVLRRQFSSDSGSSSAASTRLRPPRLAW